MSTYWIAPDHINFFDFSKSFFIIDKILFSKISFNRPIPVSCQQQNSGVELQIPQYSAAYKHSRHGLQLTAITDMFTFTRLLIALSWTQSHTQHISTFTAPSRCEVYALSLQFVPVITKPLYLDCFSGS